MFTRLSRHTLWFLIAASAAAVIGLGEAPLHAAPLPDPPVLIPYTGYLQIGGVPFAGFVKLDVALYDPTATQPFWQDSYPSVSVNNGRFNIVLGSHTSNTQNALIPGYLNGSVGSGQPLSLQVTVNSTPLSPRQTLYAAPYANVSGTANHSPGDFNMFGGLTLTNIANRAISFLSAGDAVNGIAYRPSGAPDALSISGAGVTVGQRLIRMFDNLIVGGTVTATGDIAASGKVTAGGGVAPAVDSGWFEVYSDPNAKLPQWQNDGSIAPPGPGAAPIVYRDTVTNNLYINHGLNFIPSQTMIQSCGALDSSKVGGCATPININGPTGYHDSGSSLNPALVYAFPGKIVLGMVSNWWIWGYYRSIQNWDCTGTPSGNCYSGYFRVLAWR